MSAFGGSQYLGDDVLRDLPRPDAGYERQQRRDAALAICARAQDRADAVHLLLVCGLIAEEK